jgi:hypothetical protein
MPTYKSSELKQAGVYYVTPGVYKMEVASAADKTSQNGNAMIKLVCKIQLEDGSSGPEVWDHLVFTPKAAWKIDQFLASIGRATIPGEDIDVDAIDLIGAVGVALIGEEPGQTNPDHKFNMIERWIFGDEREGFLGGKSKPAAKKPAPASTKDEDGDEIPF